MIFEEEVNRSISHRFLQLDIILMGPLRFNSFLFGPKWGSH